MISIEDVWSRLSTDNISHCALQCYCSAVAVPVFHCNRESTDSLIIEGRQL